MSWTISAPALSTTSSSTGTACCSCAATVTRPMLGDTFCRFARNLTAAAVVTFGIECQAVTPADPRRAVAGLGCRAVRGVRFEEIKRAEGDELLATAERVEVVRSRSTAANVTALVQPIIGTRWTTT